MTPAVSGSRLVEPPNSASIDPAPNPPDGEPRSGSLIFSLDQASAGQPLRIVQLTDTTSAANATRLGLIEGAVLHCVATIPGGPVVIKLGGMELAIGRSLCQTILVSVNTP